MIRMESYKKKFSIQPKQISIESYQNVGTIRDHPTLPSSSGKETHLLKIQSLPNIHTDIGRDEETFWESRESEWSDITDRTVLVFNSFNWSDDFCFWLFYCYCVLVFYFGLTILPFPFIFVFDSGGFHFSSYLGY